MSQPNQVTIIVELKTSGQGWEFTTGLYVVEGKIIFKHESNNYIEETYLCCENEYDIEEYRRAIAELKRSGKCNVRSEKQDSIHIFYNLEIGVSKGAQVEAFGGGLYFSFCSGVGCSETVFTDWTVEKISV
jgi:hypothetical protein